MVKLGMFVPTMKDSIVLPFLLLLLTMPFQDSAKASLTHESTAPPISSSRMIRGALSLSLNFGIDPWVGNPPVNSQTDC